MKPHERRTSATCAEQYACYIVVPAGILGERDIADKARNDSKAEQSEHPVSLLHHMQQWSDAERGVAVVKISDSAQVHDSPGLFRPVASLIA